MKKTSFYFLFLILFSYNLHSQQVLIDEYPLLTLSESNSVEKKLNEIKRSTGVEVCCYIAKSLENKTPEVFTLEKGNTLKIGTPGINNAVFIMIAPVEQQLYITMSYGVQWIIPDQKTESLIDLMTRSFRDKQYCDGILEGLEVMKKDLSGFSWIPVKIDIKKTDLSKYIGKVITFEYTKKSDKWKFKHPVTMDVEFDRNYKIGIYDDTRKIAELFFSKYMDNLVNSIVTSQELKIFARVRKVNPNELELLGILN
jgi:hypothetical protein